MPASLEAFTEIVTTEGDALAATAEIAVAVFALLIVTFEPPVVVVGPRGGGLVGRADGEGDARAGAAADQCGDDGRGDDGDEQAAAALGRTEGRAVRAPGAAGRAAASGMGRVASASSPGAAGVVGVSSKGRLRPRGSRPRPRETLSAARGVPAMSDGPSSGRSVLSVMVLLPSAVQRAPRACGDLMKTLSRSYDPADGRAAAGLG